MPLVPLHGLPKHLGGPTTWLLAALVSGSDMALTWQTESALEVGVGVGVNVDVGVKVGVSVKVGVGVNVGVRVLVGVAV